MIRCVSWSIRVRGEIFIVFHVSLLEYCLRIHTDERPANCKEMLKISSFWCLISTLALLPVFIAKKFVMRGNLRMTDEKSGSRERWYAAHILCAYLMEIVP